MGYLLKNTNQIITAKVLLTKTNLLTPGYIFDIPEYSAVNGYFWNPIYMNGEIINGSTPYIGTSTIHIQTNGLNPIMRFQPNYMGAPTGAWIQATFTGNFNLAHYQQNKSLQIHNTGTLSGGDNELMIYIGANLIKY